MRRSVFVVAAFFAPLAAGCSSGDAASRGAAGGAAGAAGAGGSAGAGGEIATLEPPRSSDKFDTSTTAPPANREPVEPLVVTDAEDLVATDRLHLVRRSDGEPPWIEVTTLDWQPLHDLNSPPTADKDPIVPGALGIDVGGAVYAARTNALGWPYVTSAELQLAAFSPSGEVLWSVLVPRSVDHDYISDISPPRAGSILLAGAYLDVTSSGIHGVGGDSYALFMVVAVDGTERWRTRYDYRGWGSAAAVADLADDGTACAAGRCITSTLTSTPRYWVACLEPPGVELWSQRLDEDPLDLFVTENSVDVVTASGVTAFELSSGDSEQQTVAFAVQSGATVVAAERAGSYFLVTEEGEHRFSSTVRILSATGERLWATAPYVLKRADAASLASDGRLYVLDTLAGGVYVFDPGL